MPTRDQSILLAAASPAAAQAAGGDAVLAAEAEDGAIAVWLVLLVILALSIRLLVVVLGPATAMERALTPETLSHLAAAQAPADSGGRELAVAPAVAAAEHLGLTHTTEDRNILLGPVYPWLLGASESAHLPRHGVMIGQCLLSAVVVLLVFAIARALLGRADAAVVAAVIVAVHPGLITGSLALSPGVWALTAVLGGLATILHWRGARAAVAGGALLGTGALIVPATLWVAPVAAVWLPMYRRTWKSLAVAAVLLIAAAAPPSLWMMRNAEAGVGARLSSEPEAALALDLAPRVSGEPINLEITDASASVHDRLQAVTRHALAELRTDLPGTFGQLVRRGEQTLLRADIAPLYHLLGLTVDPVDPMQAIRAGDYTMASQPDPAGARLALGLLALDTALLGAAIAGIGLLVWRRHRIDALLPVALILGCAAAASLTLWPDNLRLLAIPCLAILACAPLASVRPRPTRAKKPKRSTRARCATSFDIAPPDLAPEPTPRTGRPI
jgi:hypothetical protein